MTLVNIDLRNAGYETGPDDRVIFYSLLVREGEFGTISTAPVTVWLEDGQASVDLAPGPVGVQIIAGGVADTRVKEGRVPMEGPTTLNVVLTLFPEYSDAIRQQFLAAIHQAQDTALARIDGEVEAAIDAEMAGVTATSQEALSRAKDAEGVAAGAVTKADTAISIATDATSTASSAVATAGQAVTTAGQAVSRVETLEALGGLSPESPVDGQTANLVLQPDTLTRGAVDSVIDDRIPTLDVREFGGFTESSTWMENRDGLQAANDYARGLPGGAVIDLPPGTYQLKGVYQDSHVVIRGNTTTLEHPDGHSGHMIIARTFSTTGTIAAGSFDLTVASAEHIEVGTVVAITGARGMSDRQNTLLATAIDATQTTGITLADPYGFPISGHMTIGSEIIKYTGLAAGGVLTGVTRGMYGTTAAPHGTTGPVDAIGVSAHHIAQVVSVSGTTVTLDRAAPVSVTGAPVEMGIVRPGIYDIRIEGNRNPDGQVHYPIYWANVGNGHGDNVYAHHAQTTVFLGLGATGNRFGTVTADSCLLRTGIGAAFWMFQSCRDNVLQDLRVVGAMFIGVYIDDRTTIASPYDGPGEANHIGRISIDIPVTIPMNQLTQHTIGLLVSGGLRNSVGEMNVSGVRTGAALEIGGQWQTWNDQPPVCTGNVIGIFRGKDLYQAWYCDAPGNAIMTANFRAHLALGAGPVPVWVGHQIGPNGEQVGRFPNGTHIWPSMSFTDEPGTGFYRPSTNMVQFSTAGKAILRFWEIGLLMQSARHITWSDDGTGDIGQRGAQRPRDVRAARVLATGAATPSTRLAADLAGVGAVYFDTQAGRPLWSDGTMWRDYIVPNFIDGNVTTPSIAFQDEPGTGFYRPSAGMLQAAILGKAVMRIWDAGLLLESGRHITWSVDNTADIGQKGAQRPRDIRAARVVATGTATASTRLAPDLAGAGAMYYDTDLKKPLWSDGTTWRDADGTAV